MTTTPQQPGTKEAGVPSPEIAPKTIEIPLSALPMPPKEGDTVYLKVVSVDEQAGVVNAVPTTEAVEDAVEGEGGSDSLASEFNKQPE